MMQRCFFSQLDQFAFTSKKKKKLFGPLEFNSTTGTVKGETNSCGCNDLHSSFDVFHIYINNQEYNSLITAGSAENSRTNLHCVDKKQMYEVLRKETQILSLN